MGDDQIPNDELAVVWRSEKGEGRRKCERPGNLRTSNATLSSRTLSVHVRSSFVSSGELKKKKNECGSYELVC